MENLEAREVEPVNGNNGQRIPSPNQKVIASVVFVLLMAVFLFAFYQEGASIHELTMIAVFVISPLTSILYNLYDKIYTWVLSD